MNILHSFKKSVFGERPLQRCVGYASILGLTLLFVYAVILSEFSLSPSIRRTVSWLSTFTELNETFSDRETLVYLQAENKSMTSRSLPARKAVGRNGSLEWVTDFRINENLIRKGKVVHDKNGCVKMDAGNGANFSRDGVSCAPHVPSTEACKYANKLYYQDETIKRCKSKHQVNICEVKEMRTEERSDFVFKCTLRDCLTRRRSHVAVRGTRRADRKVVVLKLFATAEELQSEVPALARQASLDGHSYLFLECTNKMDNIPLEETIGQLLIVPPYELNEIWMKRNNSIGENLPSLINVNLLFIDSVARPHFYRSLPTVVDTFKALNEDDDRQAQVLDFELFQAVEGHTAENAHALLTGTLFPKHFTGSDREATPVGYGKLFEKFTKMGYHIEYQDDLCYDEYWGIRLELGSPDTYKEFDKRLAENHIHRTGVTFGSCRLLKLNGVTNPFNGPAHPLCYNNRFTAEYYLEYAMQRLMYASSRKLPLFTYTVLNVAHDHTGRRVQSVDWVLSEYVRRSAALHNTLTVILSDHGNTYTHYTHAIMEGRFEQFHPLLFLLIPNSVESILGERIMKNLRYNQRRLFTMLDIHFALASLPTWSKADTFAPDNRSLFHLVSDKRTCDDLSLRLPNLCICENWGTAASNKTDQIGVLEFSVGQLNNMISLDQAQLPLNQTRRCKRLVPRSFFDITERNDEGSLVSSLSFSVTAGNGADDALDVFTVQVSSNISPGTQSRDMKLLSFDRLSRFGPYEPCRDKVVQKRLCICDIAEPSRPAKAIEVARLQDLLEKPTLFPVHEEISNRSLCVHSVVRKYADDKKSIWSASFEVANLCNTPIRVTLGAELKNMKTSGKFPVKQIVPPRSIFYLGGVMRSVPYWPSWIEKYDFLLAADDSYMAIGFR